MTALTFTILGCAHRAGTVIATDEVLAEVKHRFNYAFKPPVKDKGWFRPSLELY